MFEILHTPLDAEALKANLLNPKAGALVTFEGWVRNHNEGQSVLSLEYEAFETLAYSEAQVIIDEAKAKFDILDVACVHRVGHLAIGEMAVWVGVVSAHRKAAFKACEFVIDEIKHRLPIWKKEHYTHGEAQWVNCQHCAEASHKHAPLKPIEAFASQMALPEVGAEGQEKLRAAKVVVVGAGGLGCAVLPYLAAAGIGQIGVCDGDTVSASNLNRQTLYGPEDIGHGKVETALYRLKTQYPQTQFVAHPSFVTKDTAQDVLASYDLILDCTDTMDSRLLLNDAAVSLKKPMLQASVYQYEGQLLLVSGEAGAPCLRCLWPTPPESVPCSTLGTMGPVVGLVGLTQAWEAIRFLLKLPSPLTQSPLLLLDYQQQQITPIQLTQTPDCPTCYPPKVDASPAPSSRRRIETITPHVIANRSDWQVVCVSETPETSKPLHVAGHEPVFIPYEAFSLGHPQLTEAPNIALYCPHGIQSRLLARRYAASEAFQCFVLESV